MSPTESPHGSAGDTRDGRVRNVDDARQARHVSGPIAGAFVLVAAAHLMALASDHDLVAALTKPLPILLLAAYALAVSKSRWLVLALASSAVADVVIDLPGGFLVGMAVFAVAHLWYVVAFVGAGVRPRRSVVAPYLSFWSLLLSQSWSDLGPLGVPVALYGLLLVATAALSACHSPRAGVGGALFLLSDAMIATRLAGWEQLPYADLLVMAAYYLGQFMLATGGPDRRGRGRAR